MKSGQGLFHLLKQYNSIESDIICKELTIFSFVRMTDGMITAGHDISDGGLITCLLEMAFAGNVGIEVSIPNESKGRCVCQGR